MTATTGYAESADALRRLAVNERAKAYVLDHPPLYQALLRAARRFIGGETLAECLETVRDINRHGHAVTIDFMGESTRDRDTANDATSEFLRVVGAIQEHQLNASVSLDLSHVGMVIDEELGHENAARIADAARTADTEMMISMEGPDRTDTVLRLHERLCERFDNVGITLQAYLYRTPDDLAAALQRPGKVRLVKGAFDAPDGLAMRRGPDLDRTYRQLAETILNSNHRCSMATHDERLLGPLSERVADVDGDGATVEFEMLKGVASEQLDALHAEGFETRVYVAYGHEWYLYLCNRLAEHPPNLFQAVADAARPL